MTCIDLRNLDLDAMIGSFMKCDWSVVFGGFLFFICKPNSCVWRYTLHCRSIWRLMQGSSRIYRRCSDLAHDPGEEVLHLHFPDDLSPCFNFFLISQIQSTTPDVQPYFMEEVYSLSLTTSAIPRELKIVDCL